MKKRNTRQGFTQCCLPKGFTLIELLVVVLIIGILAAVALPQYNKAVEKSRMAEALIILSAFQKAADIYLLENGWPTTQGEIELLGDSTTEDHLASKLDIDIEQSLICDQANGNYCRSKSFVYDAKINKNYIWITAMRYSNGDITQTDQYDLIFRKEKNMGWEKRCWYNEDLERSYEWCNNLTKQGWVLDN